LRKQKFSIIGATSSVNECCVVAKFKLIFGAWAGYHEFIVTDNLHSKDMIMGRDFLKLHRVVVDHGQDTITIQKLENDQEQVESIVRSKIDNKSLDRSVVVLNTVSVDPRTEKFVKCKLNEN
jgi:hypothetical protein